MGFTLEKKITIFAPEVESRKSFSDIADFHIIGRLDVSKIQKFNYLFIETSASRLPEIADIIKVANEHKYLRALFIRTDIDAKLLPQMLQRADLRVIRNILVHSDFDWITPIRVLNAWKMGSEHDLIAAAAVFNARLYVLNCAFEKFEVAFSDLPVLKKIHPSELVSFEIDKAGSFLHWPKQDIHVDIDDLRYFTDEKWRLKIDQDRLIYDTKFGAAIMTLREEMGVKQKDIAGLTSRQLRRIEKGEARPRIETFSLIAKGHKMSLDEYLEHIGNNMRKLNTENDG